MALSKNDEQLLDLLLQERGHSGSKKHKPFYIKILQFSTVMLSLVLFITVASLGVLLLTQPEAARAANTYTETWTATNGVYTRNAGGANDAGGAIQYIQGIPASGTTAGFGGLIFNNGIGTTVAGGVTVTQWAVTGSIQ